MGQFHFHDRFSKTMGMVLGEIKASFAPAKGSIRILDLPAGAGRLTDSLRAEGFSVVSADINRVRGDYVFADMNSPLPFENETFDAVVSLEGIEHILNPSRFVSEVSRMTKRGGTIILTTPNISCFYSRLMFMCTGNFFQFWPTQRFVNVAREETFDYGHATPLSWQQIAFLFENQGVTLTKLTGNKTKRRLFLPLYAPFMLAGFFWSKSRFRRGKKTIHASPYDSDYYDKAERFSFSRAAMLSRNIIMVFRKR